jgi:hypothetical protein
MRTNYQNLSLNHCVSLHKKTIFPDVPLFPCTSCIAIKQAIGRRGNGAYGGDALRAHGGAGEPGVRLGRGEGVHPGHGRGDARLGGH